MKKSEIKKLVRHYQELLGLGHWDINIYYKEIGGGAIAENMVYFKYRKSNIFFDKTVVDGEKLEYIKHTIIHELLHCYLGVHKEASDDMASCLDDLYKTYNEEGDDTTSSQMLYLRGYNDGLQNMSLNNEEYSVEQLTRIFVKLLK